MNGRHHSSWEPSAEDLVDLTPVKARELLVRCFVEAQGEMLASAKRRMGVRDHADAIERTIRASIKSKFAGLGLDYENPTCEGIALVLDELAKQASAMGTPSHIVVRHVTVMKDVLARCRK